jgi:hypothetical protein
MSLLLQGNVSEAEKWFRQDMDTSFFGRCHPDNLWALQGLCQCLVSRLSAMSNAAFDEVKSVTDELELVRFKIDKLRVRADTDVTVACMCAGVK